MEKLIRLFLDSIDIDVEENEFLKSEIKETSRTIAKRRWHEDDVDDYSDKIIELKFKFEEKEKERLEF